MGKPDSEGVLGSWKGAQQGDCVGLGGGVLTPEEQQGQQPGPQQDGGQPQQRQLHSLPTAPPPSGKLWELCRVWGESQRGEVETGLGQTRLPITQGP